jgi:hypothetical protein
MAQPSSIKFEFRNDRGDHLRGLATARPEVAGDPPAVELYVRNERVAAENGDDVGATLGFLVPGNGDSAEAFFDDLADAFANYPRNIRALLEGWWAEPLATHGVAILPEEDVATKATTVKAELGAPQPDGAA